MEKWKKRKRKKKKICSPKDPAYPPTRPPIQNNFHYIPVYAPLLRVISTSYRGQRAVNHPLNKRKKRKEEKA